MPEAGPALTAAAAIGPRLRLLRTQRGLSLTEVAQGTGISASFLSLVETGKNDITFGRLSRLIGFYGIEFGDLVSDPAVSPVVLRAGDEHHVVSPGEGIDVLLLAHQAHGVLTPAIATYEPGGHTTEPLQVEGDEFVYVIEGKLELTLEGERDLLLETGDSAYVSSKRPRSYRNCAKGRTRALFVVTARR